MARQWTAEERERQSALIRNWRPWEKSTGPKTLGGKVACKLNPMKHGLRSAEFRTEQKRIHQVLRDARATMRRMAEAPWYS